MGREDRIHGTSMAHQRPGPHATGFRFGILRHGPCRHFGFASVACRAAAFSFGGSPFGPSSAITVEHLSRNAKAVEHAAQLLRHGLAHDLGHALAERDPAPLGVALDGIGTVVIQGHVLRPVARHGTVEPIGIGKIVAAIMQVHAVAMPRQGDIAAVGVHAGRCQDMDPVDRHTLRLVDRRGITVIDPVVILEVEAHGPAIVDLHGHGLRADQFNGPECAIFDAKPTLVLQEHDAVSVGEVSRAALDRDTHLIAQGAGGPHPSARRLVQRAHLVIGMGQDDPAPVRRDLPVAVPARDQIAPRLLAGHRLMHHAIGPIGFQRMADFAGRQIARGVALPVFALTAYFADLRPTMTLMDRPESCARLDSLQLLRIADQHDLGARLGSTGHHALELACADHARLVDDEHLARFEQITALFPAMLQAGNRARRNARSAFEVFRGNAGQCHAPDLVAGCLPGLPRHPQHRALSRPGMADHDAETASIRDMRQRLRLLRRQHQTARFRLHQSGLAVRVTDLMALPVRQQLGSAMQALFCLDHSTGGESILAACVLAEFDQIGRSLHCARHLVELVEPITVTMRELRQIPACEGRLLLRDGVQSKGGISDDPRAVVPRDLAVHLGAVGLSAFACDVPTLDAFGRCADLALRLQREALGFQTAMIDSRVDIELGQALVGELRPAFAPALDHLRAIPIPHLLAKAVLVDRAHRQHDMSVGLGQSVLGPVPMYIEIGNHAQTHELGSNEVPG